MRGRPASAPSHGRHRTSTVSRGSDTVGPPPPGLVESTRSELARRRARRLAAGEARRPALVAADREYVRRSYRRAADPEVRRLRRVLDRGPAPDPAREVLARRDTWRTLGQAGLQSELTRALLARQPLADDAGTIPVSGGRS